MPLPIGYIYKMGVKSDLPGGVCFVVRSPRISWNFWLASDKAYNAALILAEACLSSPKEGIDIRLSGELELELSGSSVRS